MLLSSLTASVFSLNNLNSPLLFLLSLSVMALSRRVRVSTSPSRFWGRLFGGVQNSTFYSDTANKDYSDTLNSMFRAVKKPSRHNLVGEDGGGNKVGNERHSSTNATPKSSPSDELFHKRKVFFNGHAKNCGLYVDASQKIPRTIHVAGSKGKGSVVEYIAAGIRSHGQGKVGIFTSPHLHTARERIKVGEDLISKEDLTRVGKEALAITKDHDWAVFFDIFLTCALTYFGEKQVEYLILEAGIGGRYDSTNFVDNPEVGVITSISLDHQAILGSTISEIAKQKAGIIKPGMAIFTPSNQDQEVIDIISEECTKQNAKLYIVNTDNPVIAQQLEIEIEYEVQMQNACIADAVMQYLKVPSTGLKNFFWPCRMEKFNYNGVDLIIDGSHNGDSVQQFLSGVKRLHPNRHIRVLFAAGVEKCLNDMLIQVATMADSIVYMQSKHFKAASEQDLDDSMNKLNKTVSMPLNGRPVPWEKNGTISGRIKDAVQTISSEYSQDMSKSPVLVICGSLFAAAETREALNEIEPTLFKETDWVKFKDPQDP